MDILAACGASDPGSNPGSGVTIKFNTNVSWNWYNGNIIWLTDGKPVLRNSNYLVYRFNSSETFNVSALASNIFGNSTAYTYEYVHNGIP